MERRREHRAYIQAAKSKPCADCGIEYPHWVMDFDHREDEEKATNVAWLVDYRLEIIQAEIDKCDVVCANCHRERTHKRPAYSGSTMRGSAYRARQRSHGRVRTDGT